jgi:hypothetical protein
MGAVGLLFVGGVLFVNAIMLLGKADPKSVGVFNLFVGALQVVIPFYLVATGETPDDILNASGIFLFGFTYLYVGITNLANQQPLGLGWYCLWVVIMAIAFSMVNFFRFDDVKFGTIWLNWAVLWGLFFLVLALGREELTRATGWTTLIMSFTTCTIPAFLILIGEWDPVPGIVAVLVSAATLVALLALLNRARPPTREPIGREPGAAAGRAA